MISRLSFSRHNPWFTGFGLFLGLGWLLGWLLPSNSPSQPIQFNHSVHLRNGMTCVDCHAGARDQEHATLPTLEICLACHEQALTTSSEEEKLRALSQAGEQLFWQRITRVPLHVYFSHRRHVTVADMVCAECHGQMEALTEPPRRPFRPMNMKACQECHERMKARNDCNDCHR